MQTKKDSILRIWRGRIRTVDKAEYADYVSETGISDYAATPGNLGFQFVMRDGPNGETEIMTLSWWSSLDAVKAFAGEDPERARYYDDDEKFLIYKAERAEHFVVI